MSVTLEELESRVSALEEAVAKLARRQNGEQRQKDWRRTVGMFSGDEVMKEIFELGRKIREEDRRKTRN